MESSTHKNASQHSENYNKKNQAKRIPLNLYLTNEFEKQIYEKLEQEKNKKAVILQALSEYFDIKK